MRLYPAIRSKMGDWNYYIVRMKMTEIAQEVQFAHDIHKDRTLSDAIQRELGEQRVRGPIVSYLARRQDRFFSAIVVAAIGGEPDWHPVAMDPDVVPAVLSGTRALRESFGVLSFGDDPKYYALDGQHRVAAIKMLASGQAEFEKPDGFDTDMMSVIIVLREDHDVPEGEWLRRYRRLFSSLNRYAKPTGRDTNIIMDEDDTFAILTRRLISDHEFFQAPGREAESFRVLTKGKNVKTNTSHFTTLQILYEMNEILLTTLHRQNAGWFGDGSTRIDLFIRPDEDWLDSRYDEVASYWDALLMALPVLREEPSKMRRHVWAETKRGEYRDLFLFWPIGQLVFARIVRNLLDEHFPEEGHASVERMAEALQVLAQLPWDLHQAPWRYLVVVPSAPPAEDSWRMRNEDRKPAMEIAYRVLRWMTGLDALDEESAKGLFDDWRVLLHPQPDEARIEEMWEVVVATRARIVTA